MKFVFNAVLILAFHFFLVSPRLLSVDHMSSHTTNSLPASHLTIHPPRILSLSPGPNKGKDGEDKNPYLGITYQLDNPPYSPTILVPFLEPSPEKGKEPKMKAKKTEVIIGGKSSKKSLRKQKRSKKSKKRRLQTGLNDLPNQWQVNS